MPKNEKAIIKVIREKFKKELELAEMSIGELSEMSGVDSGRICALLEGRELLRPEEMFATLKTLGVSPPVFLSADYKPANVKFRNVCTSQKRDMTIVRHLLGMLADQFDPPAKITAGADHVVFGENSESELLKEALLKEDFAKKHIGSNLEKMLNHLEIPIIPIFMGNGQENNGEAFESFLYSTGQKSILCYNPHRPPNRLAFSICHEVAHYLFDSGKNLNIDTAGTLFPNFQNADPKQITEFKANKFAQFFLCPIGSFGRIFVGDPGKDKENAHLLEREINCSSDVAFYSYCDWLYLEKGKPLSREWREIVKPFYDRLKTNAGWFAETQRILDRWQNRLNGIIDKLEGEVREENFSLLKKYFGRD